jgi:3-oxoacyl-[acyl-carrier protein] reductase
MSQHHWGIEGKVALVTGGTKGIGLSIAKELLKAGAKVIITGRTKPEKLLEGSQFLAVDFLSDESKDVFFNLVSTMDIDILVNNAGINRINVTHNIDDQDWDQIIDLNLKVPMSLSKILIPKMIHKKWGRVLNIASVFGVVSKSERASYSASKFGLIGLTKSMALDYAKYGILINSLSPGFIKTELTEKILGSEGIKEILKSVPLNRLGTPEDVALVALFMISELNRFMTGENVVVDGGFVCA